MWEHFEGDLPNNSVQISGLKAERLSDLWRQEFYDSILDGNECMDDAIAEYRVEQTEEYTMEVLRKIRERLRQDGHIILPVEQLADTTDGDEAVERFKIITVERESGEKAVAVFTSYAAVRKAPKTATLSLFIGKILDAVYKDECMSGVIINPRSDEFFLPKPMIGMILDTEKKMIW